MKQFLGILTLSAFITHGALAEDFVGPTTLQKATLNDATFKGPANLKEVKAKSLDVEGPLEFHDLKVEQETKVRGPVSDSEKGTFGSFEIRGPFAAKDVTCMKFKGVGPVEVTDLTVSGKGDIVGPLDAQKSSFQDLKVRGPVDVVELTVKGETDIIGALDAKKSHLQNLTIRADDISLDDVEVKNIVVAGRKDKEQVLQLKGKTVVSGNITFESGKGIVEQGKAVKIQGEVKGAKVEKE